MTNPLHYPLKSAIWFGERRLQVNGGVINAVADGRRDQRFSLAMRYFSWKKMLNFIRVELQLRLGRTKVSGLPYEWEIDTTNICQLKCPLCHTGLGTIHRDKGVMHYDVFTKTVDQIKDHCIWLTLYSWGEPFLNRRIHEFVAYAHQNKIATIISSNLNKPLTPEMAESIIKAGLDVMIVSLDGVTQDVYEVYRVGGHLDRVLDNIRLLVQKKKELGCSTPHLEWQFIVMRQNEHQIPAARGPGQRVGHGLHCLQKKWTSLMGWKNPNWPSSGCPATIPNTSEPIPSTSLFRRTGSAAGGFGVAPWSIGTGASPPAVT